MELLVPGLIIVALMVWASTKIKKAAAQAYEAELVETDLFRISKPEGFISPVREGADVLFEAYTKDFGIGPRADERQVTAEVRPVNGDPAAEFRKSFGGAKKYNANVAGVIEGKEGGDPVFCKIAEGAGTTLVLRIKALEEHFSDNARKIEELLGSFEAK